MKGITIRAASPEDYPAISDILKAAFQGADEADLVDRLRQDNDVVLELVALKHETIVGHILFSRLKVADDRGFPMLLRWRLSQFRPITRDRE